MKKALIIVDMQNDFMPEGALGVSSARSIIPKVNALLQKPFDLVIASKDMHPKGHISFASRWNKKPGSTITVDGINQALWPDHCVVNSVGAELVDTLDQSAISIVVEKGKDPDCDCYSVFYDVKGRTATDVHTHLQQHSITDLYIAGLTIEYCIKKTVLDALTLGYNVYVVADASKGVEQHLGDSARALDEMKLKGAHIIECL